MTLPLDENDPRIVSYTTPLAEGCPVLTKTRSMVMQRGISGVIQWNIKNKAGQTMDLSNYLCDDPETESDDEGDCGRVNVRFQDIFGTSNILQDDAVVVDSSTGLVQVEIPPAIANTPAIFKVDFGVYDSDDNLLMIDSGMLSVEKSAFSAFDSEATDAGPLTLSEVRMQLRDTAVENNLLDNVEFDDAEIVHSLIQPIREWNETPPPIGIATAYNFPFKYNWLMATVANLLKIAASHYMRNDLQSSHGGVTVGDKAKASPYLQVAQQLSADWKMFVREKKVSLNAEGCYGYVDSPYGNYWW